MSNFGAQHPEDGLLLRYIDGELPARKRREVERHLAACWQCRSEVEAIEKVVSDCMKYRKTVAANVPGPPNAWRDLYREFDRIDSEEAGRSWLSRLGTPRWAVAAAAAAVLLAAIVYQFRQTPSVQAAALLQRAVAAAETKPVHKHRIQIRTKAAKIVRTVGQSSGLTAQAGGLRNRFEAAHYDWDDPLSAKAYQGWRGTLASKEDQVNTVADCYQIHTTTPEGDLTSATLMLRETDLEPVEARFEFRDQEWVELTELSEGSLRDDVPPAVAHLEPPGRPAEPSRSAASSSQPASPSEELAVVAALHRIGADLGDPVDVTRSASKVLVSGVGLPPGRQQDIRDAVGSLPNVSVDFTNPAAAPVPAEPAGAAPASGGGAAPPIQTRLEQALGGHADFERFSEVLLERKDALMSRAAALHNLAQRFSDETGLSEQDRALLRQMAHEHAAVLSREAATIERAFEPVLKSMGGSASSVQELAATSWQAYAEELWRTAHRLELLLSESLGASQSGTPADRLPSELLTAIKQLRREVDQFQSLNR
jgi:hypothetical protein